MSSPRHKTEAQNQGHEIEQLKSENRKLRKEKEKLALQASKIRALLEENTFRDKHGEIIKFDSTADLYASISHLLLKTNLLLPRSPTTLAPSITPSITPLPPSNTLSSSPSPHLHVPGASTKDTPDVSSRELSSPSPTNPVGSLNPPKKENVRSLIVQEIVDTEKSYVKSLKILKEEFQLPIKAQGVLTKEERHALFINSKKLYVINSSLLKELTLALAQLKTNPLSPFTHVLSSTFMKPEVQEEYRKYILSYEKSNHTLEQMMKNKKVSSLIIQLQEISRHLRGQSISSLLIQPIQRLPRYLLLLKTLLKNTPSDHIDYQNIVQSEKIFEELTLRINEDKRDTEQCAEVTELLSRLKQYNWRNLEVVDLPDDPSRRKIAEGPCLYILGNGEIKKRWLILFTDAVVCVKKKKEKFVIQWTVHLINAQLAETKDKRLNLTEKRMIPTYPFTIIMTFLLGADPEEATCTFDYWTTAFHRAFQTFWFDGEKRLLENVDNMKRTVRDDLLKTKDWDKIRAIMDPPITLQKDELIFNEGCMQRYVYRITKGSVRIEKMIKGDPVVISVLESGEYFGELSYLQRGESKDMVTAASAMSNEEGSIVWKIDQDNLDELLKKNLSLAERFFTLFCFILAERILSRPLEKALNKKKKPTENSSQGPLNEKEGEKEKLKEKEEKRTEKAKLKKASKLKYPCKLVGDEWGWGIATVDEFGIRFTSKVLGRKKKLFALFHEIEACKEIGIRCVGLRWKELSADLEFESRAIADTFQREIASHLPLAKTSPQNVSVSKNVGLNQVMGTIKISKKSDEHSPTGSMSSSPRSKTILSKTQEQFQKMLSLEHVSSDNVHHSSSSGSPRPQSVKLAPQTNATLSHNSRSLSYAPRTNVFHLEIHDWDQLLSHFSKPKTYQKEEMIVPFDNPHQTLYQILSGSCRVEIEIPSNIGLKASTKVVGSVMKNEIFGEINFLIGGKSLGAMIADSENVTVLAIEKERLVELFKYSHNKYLAAGFYHFLARKMRSRLIKVQNALQNSESVNIQ